MKAQKSKGGMTAEPIRRNAYSRPASALAIGTAAALALGTTALSPLPAQAQQQGGLLEEIVVTARYREESLQQTPLAVSAFTGENLEARAITNLDQMGEVVPNAYINPNGIAPTIGIRGVIQSDFMYAFEPAVGVYIDDLYFGTLVGSNFDLLDLDRAEVLRGPQGTLFGKNSIGGAIRLITRKPEGDGTGYVEATLGNYDRVDVKGAFDIALAEDLFLRTTAMSKSRDGYIKQLDFTCQMKANGTPELAGIGDGVGGAVEVGTSPLGTPIHAPVPAEPGSAEDNAFAFPESRPGQRGNDCQIGSLRGDDVQGARTQLRYVGTEDLEVLITADYTSMNSPSYGGVMFAPRSQGLDTLYNLAEILPRYGIEFGDGRFMTEDPYTTFATFNDPIEEHKWPDTEDMDHWGVAGTVDYDVTDTVHAKFITGYREYTVFRATDGDFTPLDLNTTASMPLRHEQWTAELQLSGILLQDRLEWTLGGFYYNADESRDGFVNLEPLDFFGFLPAFEVHDTFSTKNRSAFLHLTYNVTDRLELAGGVRYTNEDKSFTFDHGPTLPIGEPAEGRNRRWDWNATVNYQVTPLMMVYGSVATGFRSPSFNPRPFTPSQLEALPAEEVTSYEAGFKGDMFDQRLRFNAAVFYMDYDPRLTTENATQCVPEDDPNAPGDPVFGGTGQVCPPGTPLEGQVGFNWFAFTNVPGKVKGVELEVTADPVENLTINYSLGYNEFSSNEDDPESFQFRHPDSLIQPEWTMNGGIQYAIQMPNMGTLTPRLDWYYRSHNTNSGPRTAPTDDNIIPGYNLFHGRLTYQTADRDWALEFEVTNLFDKLYYYDIAPPGGQNIGATPGAPRQWGVTLRRNF